MSRGLPKGAQVLDAARRADPGETALLDSLLGKGAQLVNLNASQIVPNPDQPRKELGSLSELAASIMEKGVLEPLIVRRQGDEYQIIAGERRYRAFLESGRQDPQLPCVLVEADDYEALEISLIENLQRKDLDVWEEADMYRKMQSELGYTVEEIARKIGKSLGHVSGRLGVSRLPGEAKEQISKFENLPQHVVVQAARAEKAGKLSEYLKMVQRGEIASAKEAVKAADELAGKTNRSTMVWHEFKFGRYATLENGKGEFITTVIAKEKECGDAIVRFLEKMGNP